VRVVRLFRRLLALILSLPLIRGWHARRLARALEAKQATLGMELQKYYVEVETPAKKALKRAVLEGLVPPDTLSMGEVRGGPALFFNNDETKEVFIGRDYEHAVDEFLKWYRELKAMGPDYVPPTAKTTQLNRHDRRAYASKKFREKQKRKEARR